MKKKDIRRPKVSRKLVWNRRGRNWIVIDPEKPAWAAVNRSGREIIKLCTGRRTIDRIASTLSEKYRCDFWSVRRDIRDFLDKMEKAGIVYYGTMKRPKLVYGDVTTKDVVLEITSCCNFNCVHCYAARSKDGHDVLSFDCLRAFIREFLEAGGTDITLSGGEPLLHGHFKEIVDFALEEEAKAVKVLTNGSLIDSSMARFLAKEKIFVQISLDGATPATNDQIRGGGSYAAAMTGIKNLVDAGAGSRAIVSMTPTKINFQEAPELVKLAMRKGVKHVHFSRLAKQGRARAKWASMEISADETLDLYKVLKSYKDRLGDNLVFSGIYGENFVERIAVKGPPTIGCNLGHGLRIRSDGKIFPCPRFDHPEFCLGNIANVDFGRIGVRLKKIRSLFLERVKKIKKCSECGFRYFCGAGCMADAVLERGTVWYADPRCKARQRFYNYYFDQELLSRMGSNG